MRQDLNLFSLRVERSTWGQFLAITALRGETPTDLLRDFIKEYIEKHRAEAVDALRGD